MIVKLGLKTKTHLIVSTESVDKPGTECCIIEFYDSKLKSLDSLFTAHHLKVYFEDGRIVTSKVVDIFYNGLRFNVDDAIHDKLPNMVTNAESSDRFIIKLRPWSRFFMILTESKWFCFGAFAKILIQRQRRWDILQMLSRM